MRTDRARFYPGMMTPFAGVALPFALASATSGPSAAKLASAILSDDAYQKELPGLDLPKPLPWHIPFSVPDALGWAALVVLVVVVVYVLARLARRLVRPAVSDATVNEPADAPRLAVPMDEAAALAAAGRFAEAVHALLLATLAALSRATRVQPSLTSREILTRARLTPDAREALGGLVLAVEVSRFGGLAPSAEDYRACLARFRAFLDAYGRAA